MEFELLTDDILDDMWNNPPTTIMNEFIPTDAVLRQIAQAQANLTAKQILNRLHGINNESGDNLDFDRQMAGFRGELSNQLYGFDSHSGGKG